MTISKRKLSEENRGGGRNMKLKNRENMRKTVSFSLVKTYYKHKTAKHFRYQIICAILNPNDMW